MDKVKIDLIAPQYAIGEPDKKAGGDDKAKCGVSVGLIKGAIIARFTNGMNNADSRVWARWLEVLDGQEGTTIEVLLDDFTWFWKIYSASDLTMAPQVAHWRVALEDYLIDLRDGMRKA